MQVAHTELPTHAGEGKPKIKDEHGEHGKKHDLHHPDTSHKKELLEKMREVKPKE